MHITQLIFYDKEFSTFGALLEKGNEGTANEEKE